MIHFSSETMTGLMIAAGLVLTCAAGVSKAAAAPEASAGLAETYAGKGLKPSYLRCEYLRDPLGIQETAPRLSWIVESGERGQKQTAYRVVVAGSDAALGQNRGDLWDSGKITGDDTTAIVYAGKPLASGQRCCWKVKVWDKDGKESEWSQPALWTMGLLGVADWKAEWIGFDKARNVEIPEANFDKAKWIWHAADATPNAPKGFRLFVSEFTLPEGIVIEKAELLAASDDKCKFVINTQLVATTTNWEQPARVDVASRLKAGSNSLRCEVENASASPAGLLAKITVIAKDGKTYTHVSDATWKSSNNPGANWHNRQLDTSAWPAVRIVGDYGIKPWGKLKAATLFLPPPAFLRTTFKAEKTVARATIYATGLGIFDLYLNGKRVSDDFFNPGWTEYTKRVRYRAYDVTGLIRNGDNALGAVLADGWYSGYVGYGHKRDHYGKLTRVLAQLQIEYSDGSKDIVATGPNWKAATGPIREADFLMGEVHDARLAMAGWDTPGFDDAKWEAVSSGSTELKPKVEANPMQPVRAIAEIKAKTITEPKPGVYVLDMGQNFAGVPRLKVKGEAGQAITLRFAERLNPDGTVYTTNLRSARATDTYICRGGEVETWQPRFTFHGFQYIEITGLKQKPESDTVVGIALSSDTPVAGEFVCSDAMLNQLHSNIVWTQRMNFIDIPTDCPQRDERLGWTGDAQVYIRTATLNCDVQAFFTKWLVDLCDDSQRADGQFPCVAPIKVAGPDGGPAWADAGVICPWTVYEVYGDRRILERHYDSMTKFIAFCKNRCKPGLLPPDKYHCFGDWLSIKADTPKEIIYMAYFAYSTKLTARAAEVLGKTEDAAKYNDLFNQIKAAFNKAYVAEDGRIKGDTQTCYVLALMNDLVDGEKAKLAAKYLVENIEARDNHLSTGFIGTKDLMLALAKIGRDDVAYRLIHNDTFPSWGFSIKHGATSIWERWNGWTPETGFGDPGMNSFAHYSFGAVYQWMVENIGGIRSAAPAYKQIVIAPQMGKKLTAAKVGYRSIRGLIESDWKLDGGKLLLNVTIPANTTAVVSIPAKAAADVTEGGQAFDKVEGVKFLRMEGGRAMLAVESGNYAFSATAEK
ncbi:MAG: glycoside hydrolase family 78 protein [Candidatus Sumerlaeota bacterium]|nr:glycoside hydrolase family 78 protein [Candidatus Sumerlaeota bacterium]